MSDDSKWCLRCPVFTDDVIPFGNLLVSLGYAEWATPIIPGAPVSITGEDGGYLLLDIVLPPEVDSKRAHRIRNIVDKTFPGVIRIRDWKPKKLPDEI